MSLLFLPYGLGLAGRFSWTRRSLVTLGPAGLRTDPRPGGRKSARGAGGRGGPSGGGWRIPAARG
ncbi:MAG: hypothetical protein IT352_11820 [Gemmatimonadales bacterium]|nr:hypothetical protein [Gemmatimonadales bacterium]